MLTVTDAFKSSILPGTTAIRRTAARVTLNVSEATVTYSDHTAVNSQAAFSDVTKVTDDVSINTYRIATCEPNFWKLDGSTVFSPAVTIDVGYASSALSLADGTFTSDPAVQITTTTFSSKGITLYFDVLSGDYPIEFDIDVKNGATSIYHLAVTDNDSAYYVLDADINAALDACDTLLITFKKMNKAYRRARLSEVFLGFQQVYGIGGSDDMISLNTIKQIDITNETLPHGEAILKISDIANNFNLITPAGIAEDLQAGAEMIVEHGVYTADSLIEYVKTGTYLFDSWKDAGQKQVALNGIDPLGYYADLPCKSPLEWDSGQTPRFWMFYMLPYSEVPLAAVNYTVFPTSDAGWLCGIPADTVLGELRLCAQWLCKVCVCDENGIIDFVDIGATSVEDIDLDDCYDDPEIEKTTPPQYIEIYYYTVLAGSAAVNVKSYKETFTGTKSYVFDVGRDHDDWALTVTGATSYTDDGFDNGLYTVTDVVGTGAEVAITIDGVPFNIVKTLYTLTNSTGSGTVKIDNPHVATETKAAEIAAWTLANYNKLLKFSIDFRGQPALEMADLATSETIHGNKDIIVTRQDLTFAAGVLSGNLEGVG